MKLNPRFRSSFCLLVLTAWLAGAGCQAPAPQMTAEPAATTPPDVQPLPDLASEPASPPENRAKRPRDPVASVASAPVPVPDRPLPIQSHPVQSAPPGGLNGEASLMIDSEPEGATVVLDGRPVGHAPVTVRVPVTNRGYLSRPVSVKVRFLAANAAQESSTAELVLTPLDRVPVRLDFTPAGARRTLATLN